MKYKIGDKIKFISICPSHYLSETFIEDFYKNQNVVFTVRYIDVEAGYRFHVVESKCFSLDWWLYEDMFVRAIPPFNNNNNMFKK